jgi:23S rRNA-/tRNA-specific pseudouridylate synthase
MRIVTKSTGRADKMLADACPEYSRAALAKLFGLGLVTLDDKLVSAGHKVKIGAVIIADLSPLKQGQEVEELPILYEDKDIIVIDKPAGIISHSRGRYWYEPSVASFIRMRTQIDTSELSKEVKLPKEESYVMGCDEAVADELQKICDIFMLDGDVCRVTFSSSEEQNFKSLIKKHLKPGFWNEYIGPKSSYFMFKDEKGEVEEAEGNAETKRRILNLCRKFEKTEFRSLEDVILSNQWYTDNGVTEATLETIFHKPSAERAGIVHRLDRATSGVMICAKNDKSLVYLQKQFAARTVKKTYIAVLEKTPKEPEAIIDAPIERNPKKPSSYRVGTNGKSSQTHYRVISEEKIKKWKMENEQKVSTEIRDATLWSSEYIVHSSGKQLKTQNSKLPTENSEPRSHNSYLMTHPSACVVEFTPRTGRTHQLRVHAAYIHCPIVGDHLYGKETDRLYLHAHTLTLKTPDGEVRTFESPLPSEFVV